MAIYGYTRVSTVKQATEGSSLEAQRRCIEGRALELGSPVRHWFVEDGVSGSVELAKRPQGAQLLATLKSGDVVISTKLDRMFRNSRDAMNTLEALKARNVRLFLLDLGGDVTGNGIGKLVFTILAAVADAERERIRERILESRTHARATGKPLGGAPHKLDHVEARRMRAAGASLGAIAKHYGVSRQRVSQVVRRKGPI